MGANNSSEGTSSETIPLNKQTVHVRRYRPPDVRQKDRFETHDKSNLLQLFDASIDKVIIAQLISHIYINFIIIFYLFSMITLLYFH